MRNVLCLRTSSDKTMNKLLETLQDGVDHLDCLIQSSKYTEYKRKYPRIRFIDIEREGFYSISKSVLDEVENVFYDEVYVTFSGETAGNYGNVLTIIDRLKFKKAFFYNCKGEKTEIYRNNRFKSFVIRVYMQVIKRLY